MLYNCSQVTLQLGREFKLNGKNWNIIVAVNIKNSTDIESLSDFAWYPTEIAYIVYFPYSVNESFHDLYAT